tara:strand:+ start:492 stop:776 length:285 start_codon:yes stop_codon:yes gene_type:complete
MAQLSTKIKLYTEQEIDFNSDVLLEDNGDGVVYIKEWNLDTPQPTQAQIDALDTQANTYEQNLITDKANNIASAKGKLEALGLSVDEIKEAFGI